MKKFGEYGLVSLFLAIRYPMTTFFRRDGVGRLGTDRPLINAPPTCSWLLNLSTRIITDSSNSRKTFIPAFTLRRRKQEEAWQFRC